MKYKVHISVAVLVILYTVGIFGLTSSYKNDFIKLTATNLLVTNFVLFINHRGWNASLVLFMVIAYVTGFFSEWLGVHTGLIFGDYYYGSALGWKLDSIPLMIGVNWLMLIYIIGISIHKLHKNVWIKAIVGSVIMVAYDFVAEPVAMAYDFWYWSGNEIPAQNYLAWFLISFFLFLIFYKMKFRKHNQVAIPLLVIQLVFFALLNVL